nr:chaperone protein DnaJ GFA2, mitochondrial [Ipomoea batatas]
MYYIHLPLLWKHFCATDGLCYSSAGVDNDEILKVREDPVFRRERSDIHVDAVLTITQVISLSIPLFQRQYCIMKEFFKSIEALV